jgi:hypothetical protein
MSVTELLEPVLTGGIRNAYFFNGRTLTAEDLRALQQAVVARQQLLGQAIGDGVVTGLEVALNQAASTLARPVVTVQKGVAINRRGEAMALTGTIDLALVGQASARAAEEGEFAACDQFSPVTLTNLGLYLLVMLPASGFDGRVPMTTVGMEGVAGACGSKYAVSGVRFRLVRVALPANPDPLSLAAQVTQLATELEVLIGQLPAPDQPQPPVVAADVFRKVSLLRNGAAHLCFGTEALAAFVADPPARLGGGGSAYARYGLLDELRTAGAMTDCEVPLALVYWTSQGLRFVDEWAVRRMVRRPSVAPLDQRRIPGLEATHQFQGQLAGLTLGNDIGVQPASISCVSFFLRLPSLGFLTPLAAYGTAGFNQSVFFKGRTVRGPAFIEGALLPTLFEIAQRVPPIDLADREMISLYIVRENRQPYDVGAATLPMPYLIFVNGQAANIGTPRFDLNYWNYAHFG